MSEIPPPPPKSCSLEELKEYSKLIDKPLYFYTEDGRAYMVSKGAATLKFKEHWKVGDSVPMPEYDPFVLEEILMPENLDILANRYVSMLRSMFYYPTDENPEENRYFTGMTRATIKAYMINYMATFGHQLSNWEKRCTDVFTNGLRGIFENEIYPEYLEKMCVNFKPAKR